MSTKPSIFFIQIATVVALALFHMAAARLALRRVPREKRALRRSIGGSLLLLILVLDLPLVHLFIFYKFFHPLVLDTMMRDLAGPFLALHANATLFGGALLIWHYLFRPGRRLLAKLATRSKRSEAADTAPNDAPANSGEALQPAPVPALVSAGFSPTIYLPRRRFLYSAGMAVAGYAAGASTLRAMDSTDDYRLERAVVKIPNLPEKLKGTTIALISDIHSSVFMTREEMDRYVGVLNGMKADMTVVVGDFVNSKLREVYPLAESFSALTAPLGVYGVTGNHDYYTGQIETVVKEIEQAGIKLLRNENLVIEKNGEKLYLMGMDDRHIYDVKSYIETGKSGPGTIENLLKGIPHEAPKLFLCHKPYPFEEYSMLGVDLMLSGHTHGGQVVIAQLDNINLSFAALASRYVAGLYKARSSEKAQMYVTRGVGTVGLPLRLNCPPEVTQVVLV